MLMLSVLDPWWWCQTTNDVVTVSHSSPWEERWKERRMMEKRGGGGWRISSCGRLLYLDSFLSASRLSSHLCTHSCTHLPTHTHSICHPLHTSWILSKAAINKPNTKNGMSIHHPFYYIKINFIANSRASIWIVIMNNLTMPCIPFFFFCV